MKGIDTMTTYIGYAVIGQNLRPTASTSGSAIAWIPQGAELTISLVDGENAWLAAVYEGEAGYVSARNVGITNAGTTCEVTGSSAKVYRTPSTSATQLYTTATGDILQLLDSTSTEGWYRVSTADGTGWAQASMLTIIVPDDGTSTSYAAVVNYNSPALRSVPETDVTIPIDTQLTVHALPEDDEYYSSAFEDWFITTLVDYTGYVQAKHIGVTDAGITCQVTAETADVYRCPSTDSNILYAVEQGAILQLLNTQYAEGWYRVSTVAGTGWALASGLTILEVDEGESGGETGGESGEDSGSGETGSTTVDFTGMSFTVGDCGDNVYNYVQKPLLDNHYYYGKNPGVFDEDTMWAVKYFQFKNGWLTDNCTGVADQATLEKLNGQDGTVEAGLSNSVLSPTDRTVPTDLTMDHDLWKNELFDAANTTEEEEIGNTANAPAAIAIAFSALTGLAITPPVICRETLANEWRDHDGVNGVKTAFWSGIANLHDIDYTSNTVNTVSQMRAYCEAGGVVLMRVKYDASYDYCSVGGGTCLVVYKVDDNYIYLQNANNRASSTAFAISDWDDANGNWILRLYGYKIA